MFNKVLLLSASVGQGHVRAAQALEKAFHTRKIAHQVHHTDLLAYTNKLFQRLYTKVYIELIKHSPEAYGWFYDYLDKPWEHDRWRLAFDKLNTRPFIKMVERLQPDITICTHFLPARLIAWLKERGRLSTRQALVVTDFDIHALWLCRHVEQYFVALDETRAHLEAVGIAPEIVSVTGIPVDPVFARRTDRLEARRSLGLDPERPTLLVTAGGLGLGPVELILRSLDQVSTPSQAVVVCGKNQELKQRVDSFIRQRQPIAPVRITAIGYTEEMHRFMAASDVLLGKTGGLTTAEALTKGLAFVIVDPIEGQEERNADHLLEEGVAVRCNNLPALGYKVDKLLSDTKRLRDMQRKAKRLSRPRAALDIIDISTRLSPPD